MSNENSTDGLFSNLLTGSQEGAGNQAPAESADDTETGETMGANELEMLKQRARLMKIPFSNNIGVEALREKINAKLADDEANKPADTETQTAPVVSETAIPAVNPAVIAAARQAQQDELAKQMAALKAEQEQAAALSSGSGEADKPSEPARPLTKAELRRKIYEENMRLVRVRITNLDPKKKDLPGEIITVANEYLGTVKKFIPYGEATDDGYHIPFVLYKFLKRRKFLQIRTKKDPKTGIDVVSHQYVREFALDVLDPLTPAELERLATAQIAAGILDDE